LQRDAELPCGNFTNKNNPTLKKLRNPNMNTNKIKTYKITFIGRAKGAIGIDYKITDYGSGDTEQMAILDLYSRYDHIHLPQAELVK
jgi:hypothetical protein